MSAPVSAEFPGEAPSFYVETLGCPKNAVDSDKVVASLLADGLVAAADPADADVVVVNTCAFIEAARQESIDVALALADTKRADAKLVVTGCMAERYGDELAAALPEADAVVGFASEGSIAEVRAASASRWACATCSSCPGPAPSAPWAYVKVAEGCDRACAFCAIPSFRGKQRSRTPESIESEVRALVERGVAEIVLVAQDLAWYGRDIGEPGSLAPLLRRLDALAPHGLARIRLLYLYPSEVHDPLVSTMLELPTVVPYFDLSLQHASARLLRRMKRWGSGDRFLPMIDGIRAQQPDAVFRSSFIVGFPGETESDHDAAARVPRRRAPRLGRLLRVLAGRRHAGGHDGRRGRRRSSCASGCGECAEVQDPITNAARAALVGETIDVLVDGIDDDGALVGRTHREAPEIDGVVRLAGDPLGPDVFARPGAIVRGDGQRRRRAPICEADRSRGGIVTADAAVAARAKRFGQGALATPANFVTLARILVAIPTLALIRSDGSSWITVALWFAITSTDSLDGWLARRDGATRSGAFLDPVADKLIVIGGLAVLADRGVFPWWPVLLIAAREFGISLYRSIAGRRGIVLPAQRLGKYKAFTQYFAVGFVLLPITADYVGFQKVVLAVAVALTHRVRPADRAPRLHRLAAPRHLTGTAGRC